MTIQIMFSVYGDPVAKARPRFAKRGNHIHTYTAEKTKNYETEVALMAKAAMGSSKPLESAVEVFIYLTYAIPQSYSKKRAEACLSGEIKHTKKPDLTNVIKAIEDGMNGIVYVDDSQITSIHSTKVFGEIAKAEILVREA
jgi:Holliday junction resolvase RusA-like endonuclease